MPNTSATYPGAASGWTNSNNAKVADSTYAEDSVTVFDEPPIQSIDSADLLCSSFSFSGPLSGDTVTGIVVEISAYRSGSPNIPVTLYAKVNSSAYKSNSVLTGGSNLTYGGSSDVWGLSLTGANLSSLSVSVYGHPTGTTLGTESIYIDYVRVTIYYSDSTPDAFSFTDVTGQSLSTVVASDVETITGLTGSSPVSLSGSASSEWRKNGGTWTSSPGTVVNNDTVQVRHTTSASFSTAVNTTLTIGGVSDTFTTTTAAADSTPNAFSLGDKSSAELSTSYSSSSPTISGINTSATVTVSGGEWRKNAGAWGSASGSVVNGDTVQVRGTSSGSYSTAVNVTLTVGGVSDTYTITTRAADVTPNAFTFTDQSGVGTITLITSNSVTMAGMDAGQNASITFPVKTNGTIVSPATNAYEVNINGGGWQNATGTLNIQNGQTLQLRMGSNGSSGVAATLQVSIGGTADSWVVTTTTGDSTPDTFTFTDTGAAQSSVTVSNEVTITGIDTSAAVSFSTSGGSAHEYSKNGGAWTAVGATTAVNGDIFRVRLTAPATVGATGAITMTVGGVADTFTVTAQAPDSTPDAFFFEDQSGVDVNTITTSANIVVAGINTSAAISITGGEYAINGGAWTSGTGSVVNGDSVQVRLTSAPTLSTTISAILTIGGVSDTFSVTTRSPDTASQYVVTFREAVYGADV